jgi:hypothetical protein
LQHKEEQKKPYKANSATIATAATLAVNPHFAALMADMANLDQTNDGLRRHACITCQLRAWMDHKMQRKKLPLTFYSTSFPS